MKPILKRYIYEDGLDIVAPLKCGTRWLEELNPNGRLHRMDFAISALSENIHSGTTFIWRPVREHFYSAVKTELSINPNVTPFDIVTEIQSGTLNHWYPHLYRTLYPIWDKFSFRFWKLRNISTLSKEAKLLDYNSHMYDFKLPTKYSDVNSAINSLSPKHKIRIEKLISEEEMWLSMMVGNGYAPLI